MSDNSRPKQGIGRGLLRELVRNRALQNSSGPIPSTSRGPQLATIKREPDSEPESRNISQPVTQFQPAFSSASQITAEALLNFCSLSSHTPVLPTSSPKRITSPSDVKANAPEVKKVKNEPNNLNAELEYQAYVKRVNEAAKRNATEFMFRPNARNDIKMEADDDKASVCPTLDGVSTCLDEINELLDPEFRIEAEKFFKTKKHTDFNDSQLPIVAKQKQIVTQVQLNRVVIIKGTTGCGKTTQVPQFIMEDCFARGKHFNIVVTQPRRLATKSIATRVCEERGWNIGELVGYQIGMDKTAGELTRLLYCTTGVLLQKLIAEKKMDNYTHIIIDEVHERSAETDLLLMVVRKFLWTQAAPVKVILMSATIDSSKFVEYFSVQTISGIPIKPYEVKITETVRPILKEYIGGIPKEWFVDAGANPGEFDHMIFDIDEPNIHPVCYRLCAVLIKSFETIDKSSARRGAVLVFLPGYEDIRFMTKNLEAYAKNRNLNWLIIPLHSSITIEEQQKVFIPTRPGERKIILSTNIAESSITVPEVVYVIDYCLTKNLVCDKTTNYATLKLEWASHNNCEQRAGRCGRVQAGRVFRMVTAEFYERYMRPDGVPELLRTPLENSILTLKALDIDSPKNSLALCIDCPNLTDLKAAILRLKRVGALTTTINGDYDEEDGELTFLGKVMSYLPLDVQLSKLVMMGYLFDCLDDCIIIAACLSLQNFFEKGFDDTIRAYKARLAWTEKTFSDPIAYWYAYRTFFDMVNADIFAVQSKKAKEWCKRNFIQYNRLKDVIILVDELKKRLTANGIYSEERPNMVRDKFEDQLILKVIIAGAFYPYYYLENNIKNFDFRKELAEKSPLDTVKLSNLPQNEGVLYYNQIKKQLSEIDDLMEMEFDSTHCYITFHATENDVLAQAVAAQTDGRPDIMRLDGALYQESTLNTKVFKENSVKTAVYLALKLAARKKSIIITKYKPQIASQRIKALAAIREGKIKVAEMFRTNRFIIHPFSSCRIPAARMPPKYVKKIEIYITEVDTNGHFWAQMRDEQTQKMLQELQRAYSEAFKPQVYPYNDPKVGDLILTRYDNEMINCAEVCRARVVRVERGKHRLEVFFIDFGGYGCVEFESLSNCVRLDPGKMPAELFTIPALAMECRLCEVKPAPGRRMIQENRYSDLSTFRDLVNHRNDIFGMIYSVVNQVVALKLFRKIDNGVSLNDKLVNDGLFVKEEEKVASKFDCEVRMNVREPDGYVEPLYSPAECCTVEPIYDEDEDKFMNERCNNSIQSPFTKEIIKLRGPYTPIAVDFQGVTKKDSLLRVAVDNDSVNSVCCAIDPERMNSRLLVASIAQLQQTLNTLTIRNTTLMPDIIGFPSLMAMIFAPRAEFRVDLDNQQYLGGLFGLGYHETTRKSYDRDNDIEMEFDCFIDNEDIADVNLLRFYISQVISQQKTFDEISGQALFKMQQDIRQQVLKILSKHRVSMPLRHKFTRYYEWIDPDQPQVNESPDELGPHPFYLSHSAAPQISFSNYKEKLADNLMRMKEVIEGNIRTAISCILCDQKFFGRHALMANLESPGHVAKVKMIFEPAKWPEFQIRNEFQLNDGTEPRELDDEEFGF